MRLNVGERLEGAGPAHQPGGYVVTSVVRETPWYGLYVGKKIFYNFDFTAKRVRETDDVEWLDVLLRTIRYPVLDDLSYVQQRRALARAEVRGILGNRRSNLWPEPLDLLEVENVRDPFAFTDTAMRQGEPVVVFTRPHGRFTPDWQQQILPVSSILSVLAELLEFLQQAHAEGLLLLGLGPASLLVDASDRVHYIGTEMVLAQQSALLKNGTPPEVWRRLFPTDRFPRGYSAPECFDPALRPDMRTDLYAWGALAYGLITGTDLSKIAQAQGRPWLTFDEEHWHQLEKVLAQLPTNMVHAWADQIGIDPQALLESWPQRFVAAFRMLLSAEPARRPRSAAELLAWLADPPPVPVAGFLALHTDADAAQLLVDCSGVDMELEMTIQCERNIAPQLPSDGTTVAQGPLRSVVGITSLPLTDDPLFYTVFTRRRRGDGFAYSLGVSTQLQHFDAAGLRRWVEEQSAGAFDGQPAPTRVATTLGALDLGMVVDSLAASVLPRVRLWALRRVEQTLCAQGHSNFLESFLWRFLGDPQADTRKTAATLLWTLHPGKTDDVLLRLVEALETPPLDVSIPLVPFLRQLQIAEERIAQVTQKLEARRPSECPICKKPLTLGERAVHLQAEHGFLPYQGEFLPADVVLARRWERVLHQEDRSAHEELIEMYLNLPAVRDDPEAAAACYIHDLQHCLLPAAVADHQAEAIPLALAYSSVVAYQSTLRESRLFVPVVRLLVCSTEDRLRDLGCRTILPFIQEELLSRPSVAELHRLLALFYPEIGQTDLQIDLCRQLSLLDADLGLVRACIAELREERLVTCTECRAEVQAKNIDIHLRRAHQVFQFRGERGAHAEIRTAMIQRVCAVPPDVPAWHNLEALAEDKHPGEAERYLVAWLYQHIKDIDIEHRAAAVKALAEVMVLAEKAGRLLPVFVGPSKNASFELLGRCVALETCARLAPPVPPEVFPLVTPILDLKELPRRSRENAALALMRSLPKSSPIATEVLRAYVAQSGKKRGLEKLQHLEQRFGQNPAIEALCQEFEDEIRMSCPRCPTELRKREMVVHLWAKHRLVLDGQRVREPWRVIEDWVVDYGLEKDPQVLQRCRDLALKDDPNTGLARLQRLLYHRGLRDRELLNELRAHVRTRQATLCPHCCTLVPVESSADVQPLVLASSRLEGYGYHLQLSESGLVPSLEIESPDSILYSGREPGRLLTRLGNAVVLAGPLTLLTYSALQWYTNRQYPGLAMFGVAVGFGLFTSMLVFFVWPKPAPVKDRIIKAAWRVLVPEMLDEDLNRGAWSFLAGLAELSKEVPTLSLNRAVVLDCCEQISHAAGSEPAGRTCLAALCRRYLAPMRERHQDPFDFVLPLADACFKGKLPLAFLSDLVENFHGPQRSEWPKSDLHRLSILLADRAFSADVDIDDWLNLGRAFPVLSAVLNLEHRWHWLQFHVLWTQREERPWDKTGEALTMLELASAPQQYEELLAYYPDVLLYVESANLVITTRGAWIEGVCVTSFPAGAEVSCERLSGGYELQIGYLRIRCSENPQSYLADIRDWLRFYFQEFVPSVPTATRPMTESRHRMWQLSKLTCPECQRPLVPCLGDLGVTVR